MLELIDQSNPQQLRYRCDRCHAVGVSVPAMANPDNSFLVLVPGAAKPIQWVRHVCAPSAPVAPPPPPPVVEEAKPKRKYTRRKDAIPQA